MQNLVFVTGNQHKADYLAQYLGMPIDHQKVDLDEIQSLELRKVTEHKAHQAFSMLGRPVLVEDVALTFEAMGRLPGTLIRWFLEDLGNEGLCKLVSKLESRSAVASIMYALHDGREVTVVSARQPGHIAQAPRGEHGFGWNAIFIPEGATKTYAEMPDEELQLYSHRAKAVEKLKAHLLERSDLLG